MLSRRLPHSDTITDLGTIRCVGTVIALICLALAGCSQGDRPSLGTVQGVVTLDGVPLPNAAIRFLPISPVRASMSMTDSSGRYELIYIRDIMGAAVGEHRVEITTEEVAVPGKLPPHYNSNTTLTAHVKGGKNEINFDLKRASEQP
jgi:hypothetical protein